MFLEFLAAVGDHIAELTDNSNLKWRPYFNLSNKKRGSKNTFSRAFRSENFLAEILVGTPILAEKSRHAASQFDGLMNMKQKWLDYIQTTKKKRMGTLSHHSVAPRISLRILQTTSMTTVLSGRPNSRSRSCEQWINILEVICFYDTFIASRH